MVTDGLATSSSCTKGDLPVRNVNDIYCPMFGGPDYKLNYLASSCRERQLAGSCEFSDCQRRVNLVRPSLVQVSAATKRQAQDVKGDAVAKKPVKECAECGRVMAIVGRGLCGRCLRTLRKDGTLDDKHPAKGPWGRAANVKDVVESDVVVPAAAVASVPAPVAGNDVETAQAHKTRDGVFVVRLEFIDRDSDLLHNVEIWADSERRSLSDQILFALDNLIAEKLERGELK